MNPLASCWLVTWFAFRPWSRRKYVPPKRRWTYTRLHGAICQKPRCENLRSNISLTFPCHWFTNISKLTKTETITNEINISLNERCRREGLRFLHILSPQRTLFMLFTSLPAGGSTYLTRNCASPYQPQFLINSQRIFFWFALLRTILFPYFNTPSFRVWPYIINVTMAESYISNFLFVAYQNRILLELETRRQS
jgi:hypothetical protein